jgi:DUF4097 and DUF4098 domain-containing protein YvlB
MPDPEEHTMIQTHETPGPLRLRLGLPSGDIDITTWDEPRTEVEIAPVRDDEAGRRAASEVRHELRRRGSGHELVLEAPKGGLFGFRDTSLRFTIRAPHGVEVDANAASADITARGRVGNVEVQTASGDTTAESVEGDATVRTASGDIDLGDVTGRARVNGVSGDIRIGAVRGDATVMLVSGDLQLRSADADVTAKSVSGDLTLETVRRGSVRAQSVSGDITIGVARGVNIWMDVSSLSGDTVSELETIDEPGSGDTVAIEIRANSTSGDIRLTRAAEHVRAE